jgi:nitrile hydratase subunit beta
MGGMHGFGPVVEPGGEVPYHERWEPRVFALHVLIGVEGLGAGPGGRPTREEMDPAHYLDASYYERWLWSAERRLERAGTIAPGDVDAAAERLASGEPAPTHGDPAMAERTLAALRTREAMDPPPAGARFEPGERVRVRRMRPAGHTRCPRYARGAVGVVEAVRGADRLPDRAVYGEPAEPEAVYSVAFRSEDLWGAGEEPPWTVRLDLWDSYLDPA